MIVYVHMEKNQPNWNTQGIGDSPPGSTSCLPGSHMNMIRKKANHLIMADLFHYWANLAFPCVKPFTNHLYIPFSSQSVLNVYEAVLRHLRMLVVKHWVGKASLTGSRIS